MIPFPGYYRRSRPLCKAKEEVLDRLGGVEYVKIAKATELL